MEVNSSEGLRIGCKVLCNGREKQGEISYSGGTARAVIPLLDMSTCKRRKLNNCGNRSLRLIAYYTNFMRSELPNRLLFYSDGHWVDFSQNILNRARENFQIKKAAFEAEVDGHRVLFDFLNMIRVELETGQQRPVAWIDEGGHCFFPELFHPPVEDESPVIPNIRLHLEVNVNSGVNIDQGESNTGKHDRVHESEGVEESAYPDSEERDSVLENVRNMLIENLGPSANPSLVAITDGMGPDASPYARDRMDQFSRQVGMTERLRGDANVRQAWMPLYRDDGDSDIMYELGVCSLLNSSTTPTSIHLIPTGSRDFSPSDYSLRENGICCVLLCRVILGNTEVVSLDSEQSRPTSSEFDSGVDSLDNPKCYVVWVVNANTHILPEYTISFQVPSWNRDSDDSSTTVEKELLCSSPVSVTMGKECGAAGSVSSRVPRVPFNSLFSEISGKVSEKAMKLAVSHYQLLKSKKISRIEFINQLRLIVGDAMLKSTVFYLLGKSGRDAENLVLM